MEVSTTWNQEQYTYYKRITERFNEKYIDAHYLQNNNDKPAVELWGKLADNDREFYEEFTCVITNADISETYDKFDPEYFDDNYLNMELALDRQ